MYKGKKTKKELLIDLQDLLKENKALKEEHQVKYKKNEAFSNSTKQSSQYARSLIEASLDPLYLLKEKLPM
jgi:hypothetical protein